MMACDSRTADKARGRCVWQLRAAHSQVGGTRPAHAQLRQLCASTCSSSVCTSLAARRTDTRSAAHAHTRSRCGLRCGCTSRSSCLAGGGTIRKRGAAPFACERAAAPQGRAQRAASCGAAAAHTHSHNRCAFPLQAPAARSTAACGGELDGMELSSPASPASASSKRGRSNSPASRCAESSAGHTPASTGSCASCRSRRTALKGCVGPAGPSARVVWVMEQAKQHEQMVHRFLLVLPLHLLRSNLSSATSATAAHCRRLWQSTTGTLLSRRSVCYPVLQSAAVACVGNPALSGENACSLRPAPPYGSIQRVTHTHTHTGGSA